MDAPLMIMCNQQCVDYPWSCAVHVGASVGGAEDLVESN